MGCFSLPLRVNIVFRLRHSRTGRMFLCPQGISNPGLPEPGHSNKCGDGIEIK